jgi:hypothetical protein
MVVAESTAVLHVLSLTVFLGELLRLLDGFLGQRRARELERQV